MREREQRDEGGSSGAREGPTAALRREVERSVGHGGDKSGGMALVASRRLGYGYRHGGGYG